MKKNKGKIKKKKRMNSLTWALFEGKWLYPRAWKYRLRDIKTMFSRIFFVIKHGYYPQMLWETHFCMIEQWQEIIKFYRTKAVSYPSVFKDIFEWYAVLDEMQDNLTLMSWDWADKDKWSQWLTLNHHRIPASMLNFSDYEKFSYLQEKAKLRFFELLNIWFYDFWD